MNDHQAFHVASPKKRAAARAIDALVTVVLAALMTMAAGCTAAVIAFASMDNWGDDHSGAFLAWFILFALLALVPVARYEVASTARRGQTFGKRCMGIRVVLWDDQAAPTGDLECPDARCSVERWVVPHGAGLLAGVVAGVVAAQKIGDYGVLVGAGVGLAVLTVVYASSLRDEHGRGWHDKAAGTVVVLEAESATQQDSQQDS